MVRINQHSDHSGTHREFLTERTHYEFDSTATEYPMRQTFALTYEHGCLFVPFKGYLEISYESTQEPNVTQTANGSQSEQTA